MYAHNNVGSNKGCPWNKESASRAWEETKVNREAGCHGVCPNLKNPESATK